MLACKMLGEQRFLLFHIVYWCIGELWVDFFESYIGRMYGVEDYCVTCQINI